MTTRAAGSAATHTMVYAGGILLFSILAAGLWFVLRWPSDPAAIQSAGFAELATRLRDLEQRFPDDDPDRSLAFPDDHGAHAKAAAEAWDFAGWVRDPKGRDFAFRLSFARLGLRPDPPQRRSAWAASAVHRGLFALADGNRDNFHSTERYARAALGLSGFDGAAGRLWLDGWAMQIVPGESAGFSLRAESGGNAVDLRLTGRKPAVVPDGFPAGGGGALRAYLQSRLAVVGTLNADGELRQITGSAWLAHAWGRLLPPGGQVALDRYQLQLDDGRELLILRLRRRDGSAEPVDRGLLIGADGRTEPLQSGDVKLEPAGWWTSPASRVRYPVRWTLRLPSLNTELSLSPLVENQEIEGSLRAWSGAVRITGSAEGGRLLSGAGFVDLSGYR